MAYQTLLLGILTKLEITGVHPHWVEASMRLEYDTLSHLPIETFERECRVAEAMLKEGTATQMENMAQSMGVDPAFICTETGLFYPHQIPDDLDIEYLNTVTTKGSQYGVNYLRGLMNQKKAS